MSPCHGGWAARDRGEACLQHVHHHQEATCVVPAKSMYRAVAALDLVHGGFCGLITSTTLGGRCFFLLLVDDAMRYMWTSLIATKSDATSAIKKIKLATTKLKVRLVLCTDNGGEFTTYCIDEGIQCHCFAPYTLQ
jgi:hypothetical protein